MSLLDTINGARKEVEDASKPTEAKDMTANQKVAAQYLDSMDDAPKTGFSKRSVTRAKPTREAGSGVRVVSAKSVASGKVTPSGKPESEMTKEEKKEAKRVRRDAEDRRMAVSQAMLGQNEAYKKAQRIWWILLGVGMGATVLTWVLTTLSPDTSYGDFSSALGILIVVLLNAAYACIIAAFVFDWREVRPMRKATDAMVASMSDRKVVEYLDQDRKRIAEEEAERARAKEAKKATKARRHEQHK